MYTERLSQALALAGTIDSASQSTSEKLTGAIDMSKFRRVIFVINCGVLGASATVDFQVKGSTTSGGTYTAISGTAITQMVKATDDNKTSIVEISAEAVQNAGYAFIKGSLVPGTAASQVAVIALGAHGRNEPTSANNAAAVLYTVAL